ncbi:FkbM family methyltransferase [Rhodospirillaceae bacterium SYSU D60014]|uniref:FkbM family methyltransferase n=1 Tax=Virgifigura deserti TaxID=2268457 RepID=UPI000E66FC42
MLTSLISAYIASPHHRGKRQILRWALRLVDGKAVRSCYGVLIRSNSRDYTNFASIGGHLLSNYDDVFAEVIQLEPGMAFVDIGANAGLFSMVACAKVGETGAVVAFEPSLRSYRDLIENAVLNGVQNFYPFNAAVGNITKIARFAAGRADHTGSAHLDDRGEITVLQIHFDDLDSLFEIIIGDRATLIKIDVEGAEGQVLDSIAHFIRKPQVKKIVAEIDAENSARFGRSVEGIYSALAELGFIPRRGMYSAHHFNEIFERE